MNFGHSSHDTRALVRDEGEDNLEYFIKFPSTSFQSNSGNYNSETDHIFLYSDENIPVVMLLGWAGCQDRYLMKYSKIYEERGLITIRYSAPVQTLFWKRAAVKPIGEKIVKLIYDMNFDKHPVILHVFSNGGAFLYQNIALAIKKHRKPLNIQGMIYDSAPGERRVMGLYRAISAIYCRDSPHNRFNTMSAIFITVTLSMVWFIEEAFTAFKSLFVSTEPVQSNPFQDLLNENTEFPELYIYSKMDDVIPYYDVEKFAKHRTSLGVPVTKICFDDAEHVKIFIKYPQQYISSVCKFINNCFNYSSLAKID